MDHTHSWQPYLGGSTLGMEGAAGGTIGRDEALGEGIARLTLEADAARSFWAITCEIPRWLAHTCYFGSAAEAEAAWAEMRPALEELVLTLPAAPDRRGGEETRAAGERLARFVARFP